MIRSTLENSPLLAVLRPGRREPEPPCEHRDQSETDRGWGPALSRNRKQRDTGARHTLPLCETQVQSI